MRALAIDGRAIIIVFIVRAPVDIKESVCVQHTADWRARAASAFARSREQHIESRFRAIRVGAEGIVHERERIDARLGAFGAQPEAVVAFPELIQRPRILCGLSDHFQAARIFAGVEQRLIRGHAVD